MNRDKIQFYLNIISEKKVVKYKIKTWRTKFYMQLYPIKFMMVNHSKSINLTCVHKYWGVS